MDAVERLPSTQGPAPGEKQYASLALVNTEFALPGGLYDGLSDADAAHEWLRERGLIAARTRVGADGIRRLLVLRDTLRVIFTAHDAGERPTEDALGRLNRTLATAPGVRELTWTEEGPALTLHHRAGAAIDVALALLAEEAAELLTGPDGAKLSACGARGCTRLFIRAHASRRWCSDRCGNRVRAARHYAGHGRAVTRQAP
ncbi:CGNR zinc finger domain-containing protein [Streptomyces sp. NPDC056883]|uniref:CGNR zinc finger domain-containing protein n=1 Tax=Streptomyces sp. NPDC056883 TaxID=3345959 RepID=UPI0036777141